MSARETVRATGRSRVTIYFMFGLIRRRMIESGLFVGWVQMRLSTALWHHYGIGHYEAMMQEFHARLPDSRLTVVTEAFMNKLIRTTLAKRGIRDENFFEHFAETTYFSSNAVTALPPATRYQIMLNIIRMTGPLNAPAKNLKRAHAFANQTLAGGIRRTRERSPKPALIGQRSE